MKPSLVAGLEGTFRFTVSAEQTVPCIYRQAPDFQMMPAVFATGYLVALCEWACVELVKPHLDWPVEQTLGTHVDLSHRAATPPGFTVSVRTRLAVLEGKRLVFEVSAHDGVETISEGRHERHVIIGERFAARLAAKRAAASP